MRLLDKAGEKVEKICEALRRETLEPAAQEAELLVKQANEERDRILREAQMEAKQLIEKGRLQIEQERSLFRSSLSQAAKQAVQLLKQQIEEALFNPALEGLVNKNLNDPKVIAQVIEAVVHALEREGRKADFQAEVAKNISKEQVNVLLAKEILNRLKGHTVEVGTFEGGAKVKLAGQHMTVDISDEAVTELLLGFMREDFRSYFFNA